MKKKLESELISIAHRILKLKNRSELDQLHKETLNLYEKISVLRFVEDNFADVKPSIGYASAEGRLEEIYETELSQGGEEVKPAQETEQPAKQEEVKKDKQNKSGEAADEAQNEEEPAVSEEEKEVTEDKKEEEAMADVEEDTEEEGAEADLKTTEADAEEDSEKTEDEPEQKEEEAKEPEYKTELEKPEEDIKAMEEGAEAVYKKEQESTVEEEEQAADAEMVTIEPDKDTEVEKSDIGFEFAFERKPAPEEPARQQKEISFEDFHDYKEPEFVKKDTDAPKEAPKDDWQNWEPKKDDAEKPAEPVKEEKKEEPKQEAKAAPKSLNDAFGKTINLGLNDRIAFEKHLFGGSGEDLNRVLSQLNTFNTFREAKEFVNDLVKPDYNNWKGKEEFEERFMGLVEKKFD